MDKLYWSPILRLSILIILFLLAPIGASGAGDPIAGETKAAACFSCHGNTGNSENPRYPKLAGQRAGYIVKQALDFKHGRRMDEIMSAVINIVPDGADLDDIAAYFAGQDVMQGAGSSNEVVEKGRQLFVRERCFFCHGDDGKQAKPLVPGAPVIGGQHETYLVKALQDIRSGARTGDIYGIMTKTLTPLSADDIAALAGFVSGL